MRGCVTGQHDLQTKFLARQVAILAGCKLSVDWLLAAVISSPEQTLLHA